MTDLRARLIDAIGDAFQYVPAMVSDDYTWAVYLSDTLLSLPGIAIVELPEPTMADVVAVEYWDCDGEQANEMHLTVAVPEDFGPNNWRKHDSPEGKRRLAAALLAAANAAERSDS